jgi:hypothetical protein
MSHETDTLPAAFSKHKQLMNEMEELMKEKIELENLKMEVLKMKIQLMEKELKLSQRKTVSEKQSRRSRDSVHDNKPSKTKNAKDQNGIWNWDLE